MKLKHAVTELVQDHTPGLVLEARVQGHCKLSFKVGATSQLYDLASLTKVIATTSLLMRAFERKEVRLDESVSHYLPWYPFVDLSVRALLQHRSGLPWWLELEAGEGPLHARELLQRRLIATEPSHDKKEVYSDLNFWLLGLIVEKVYASSLNRTFTEMANEWKLPSDLRFRGSEVLSSSSQSSGTGALAAAPSKKEILATAPTQKEHPTRGKIQGVVHDDNAWKLGGVAGHAGLFGSLKSVSEWGERIRRSYLGEGPLKRKTLQSFFQPSQVGAGFALGWMKPSVQGASCGQYMGPMSVGHLGFTGCSFWYDPKKDIQITVLSNRTYQSVESREFAGRRGPLHDLLMEHLIEKELL